MKNLSFDSVSKIIVGPKNVAYIRAFETAKFVSAIKKDRSRKGRQTKVSSAKGAMHHLGIRHVRFAETGKVKAAAVQLDLGKPSSCQLDAIKFQVLKIQSLALKACTSVTTTGYPSLVVK